MRNPNKEKAMKSIIIMVATMAITFLSTFASAQTTTPPAPASEPEQTNIANKNLIGHKAIGLMTYKFNVGKGAGYFARVEGNLAAAIEAYVKKASNQTAMHSELDPFVTKGHEVLTAWTTVKPEKTEKWWTEEYLPSRGCDMGEPESDACKAMFEEDLSFIMPVVDSILDDEDKMTAVALIVTISEYYRANEGTGRKVNYPMLDLALQAALESLALKYRAAYSDYVYSLLMESGGTSVVLSDLSDIYGKNLLVLCPGSIVSGPIAGETDASTLYIELEEEAVFKAAADELVNCHMFLYEGEAAPTPWELASKAKENDEPIEGRNLLSECPEDMDILVNREVAVYSETLETRYGVITSISEDGKSFVMDETDTISCEDMANGVILTAFGPENTSTTKVVGAIRYEVRSGFVVDAPLKSPDNMSGIWAPGFDLRLRMQIGVHKNLAISAQLGLRGQELFGHSNWGETRNDKRFTLFGSVGTGLNIHLHELVDLNLMGELLFAFHQAGVGGMGGLDLAIWFGREDSVGSRFGISPRAMFGSKPYNRTTDCRQDGRCAKVENLPVFEGGLDFIFRF